MWNVKIKHIKTIGYITTSNDNGKNAKLKIKTTFVDPAQEKS